MPTRLYPPTLRRFSPVRLLSLLLVNLLWIAPLLLAPATAASAQTFTVTTTADSTDASCGATCSLRDALTAANSASAAVTIDMTGISGTITLGSALPTLSAANPVTITGPGAGALTVDGAGKYQVFSVSTGSLTISGLTIANANVTATGGYSGDPGYGAAVYGYTSTTLALSGVNLNNNYAANGGGAIFAAGTLTVSNSSFSGNSTDGAGCGAPPCSGYGGAIFMYGTLNVTDSTFSGNSALGGGGVGGAIYNDTGTSTIDDSTFYNNTSGFSGGIDNTGTLTAANDTFIANIASGSGLGNEGSGILNTGTLTTYNNIFGASGDTNECYPSGGGCPSTDKDVNGNLVGDPNTNLSSFGNYGGVTSTFLPLSGSAAICEGVAADFPGGVATGTDQRGGKADPSCPAGAVDAGSVQTNYLTVTSSSDDPTTSTATCGGTCTLRDAINTAVNNGSGDIKFSASLNGSTITLGAELPTIGAGVGVNILGPGANQLAISGANTSEILFNDGGSVSISGVTLENGSSLPTATTCPATPTAPCSYSPGYGGAITNAGTLTLSGVIFANNTAGAPGTQSTLGGAIYNNSGALTISDATFSGNTADLGSVIYNNSSAGLTIQYSTFSGNSATNFGGVYNSTGSPLTVENSTFTNNTNIDSPAEPGTGVLSFDTFTVSNTLMDSTMECDYGGTVGCPTTNGNIVSTAVSALGNYGGSTPTVLPLPGSTAICGGVAGSIPSGFTTDQRGFSNVGPAAYGVANCSDSGSVQTDYTSLQFVAPGPPYTGNTNSPSITPTVVVSVTENGMNQGGVPLTLTLAGGADTIAAGTGTATTVTGTGATFGNLTINGITGGAYTLSTSLTVVGTDTLSAGPENLTLTAGPTIVVTPSSLSDATVGAAYSVTLHASGGTGPYTWSETGTLPTGITFTGGVFSGTPTQAGGPFSITVTATDTNGFFNKQTYSLTVDAPTITMTPPAGTLTVTTGVAYSQVFTATGGTAPYTYTETGDTLPTGLAWNASTHTISGTTTATGTYHITVTAKDSSTGTGAPFSQGFAYTLTVSAPSITIAPTSITLADGTAFSQQLTASGGATPYTYTVSAGTLPAGLTLSSAGLLSGTPTAGGAYSFTVKATDNDANTGTQAYTGTIAAPTISITPANNSTLNVTTNIAFSQTFTASGGTAPYTYVEAGDTLPTGLSWNASTHTISGTTAVTGTYHITVKATDNSTGSGPYSQTNSYTIVVGAPTITIAPTSITLTDGTAFSQQLTASGGATPYTYTVSAGTLPAGLTLSSAGLLSGTPTAGGAYSFTVKATDTNSNTGTQVYSGTIAAATITIAPAAGTLNATAEAAYTQVFTASGGTGPYTYVETGALPAGITWSAATGTLSGTPTVSGSFPFTIKATDSSTGSGPYSVTNSYTLAVAAPGITMLPAAGPLTATVATAYTQAFTASGGASPYTYSETGALPAGLTFTGNTLSGTPTAGGSFPITVTAKDNDGFTHPQNYTLTVNAPTITIAPAAGTLNLTAETAYTQAFTASGGTGPYTYVETGALPAGITWSAASGTLSGTATASGSFPITIKATDSSTGTGPYSVTNNYTLTVGGPTISIAPNTLPAATADAAYSQQLTASGGTGPYTYTETGALPTGVTLSTAGLLSGTPTVAGSFPITVTAKDTNNFTGTLALTLTVTGPTLVVTPGTLPAATTYTAYTATFSATGGLAPYTWSETGALPTGVTFNAATATLSGTPSVSGTFPITITVKDSTTGTGSPFSKSVGYTLAVSAPTIVISPATLPAATIAVAYSQTVTASGGSTPYTYTITTGALPAGLTMSTAGAITGTPTAGGTFSFTVTAKDSGSFTGTQNYSLTVNAPTITLTPPAGTLAATANTAFTQTFTASGGTAPYTWVEAGALPTGITWNAATATLSGTPTVNGSFPITITAKDSSTGTGPYSSAATAYTLTVGTTSISITWANPAAITYGTSLAGVLDATVTYNGSPVPGTFTYSSTPGGAVTAATVLGAGSYTLTASFAPSSSAYATPTPKTVPLTVNQASPTITWTPAGSIAYGTTLSALLNATASFNSTAVGGSFAYTATPAGGTASPVTGSTVLMTGTYTLTATFTPSDATDYKSVSATAPLSVTGSTLTVSANNATRAYGAANPTFTGTITGQVNGDTFTESFATTATATSNVGTYSIVPTAAGANLSDYTVVTNDGTLTITKANTTTTLAANSNTVNPGATLTLTATVASTTTGTPTGTVDFYDGTTLLGSGTLSGGTATYSTTTLAAGSSNTLTAVYSGDSNFNTSTTTTSVVITVGGLDFTLGTPSPATQTGKAGGSFQYSFSVSPNYGSYPATVYFTAIGLPSGALANFSPASIAANGGTQTVTMDITTSNAITSLVHPDKAGRGLLPLAFALFLLPLAGTKRMRRQGRWLGRVVCLLLLVLGGLGATSAITGCGSHAGTVTNSYTITITATSGSVQHTQTVTLSLTQQ